MSVFKWDPPRDLPGLENLDDRLRQGGVTIRAGKDEQRSGPWTPPIDILESADRYVLRADLPGTEAEDIELRVQDGILILRGHRKAVGDERPDHVLRAERPHGAFVQSFRLPSGVDQSGVKAWLKNGVLEVIMPKKQESKARAIRIESR